jgi:hypothetical protein
MEIKSGNYKHYKNKLNEADIVIFFELNFIEKWWYNKYPQIKEIEHPNIIRVKFPYFLELNPYMIKDSKISLQELS